MNICHTARQSIVMEPRHGCKLEDLCRICGCKLFIDRKQAKVKKSYPCTYQSSSYTEEILQAFHIDTKKDSPEIHPQKLCNKCYLSMKRVTAAAQKKTPYKCSVEPYDWFIHSVERCKVLCPLFYITCIRYTSYRAAMVISHFIQHGGRRQESWEVLQLKLWNT